jgi:protein SCO1/2
MPDTKQGSGGLRRVRYVLWGLVILALGAIGWLKFGAPALEDMADAGTAALGQGEYRLAATDGGEFTAETLKGQPSAVFFGFTHCPDVCPTTLGDIAGWQEELGDAAKDLRVFFVTVDPERDSVDAARICVLGAGRDRRFGQPRRDRQGGQGVPHLCPQVAAGGRRL